MPTFDFVQFSNNATTRLAAPINSTTTTVVAQPFYDTRITWPDLTIPNSYFMAVIVGPDRTYEIVRCTAVSIDSETKNATLTIKRAQEGTIAASFPVDSLIENRVTAEVLQERLNYVVTGMPGPPGEKGDQGDPGPEGPQGVPGDGFPDPATPTKIGLVKPDNVTTFVSADGTLSAATSLPAGFIFDPVSKHIMYMDTTLGINRSVQPLNIGFSMYPPTELPWGHYHANGSSVGATTNPGKVLMSLSPTLKDTWNIRYDSVRNTVTLPNMYNIDGRGYFVRAGTDSGIAQGDTMRNLYGVIRSIAYGVFDKDVDFGCIRPTKFSHRSYANYYAAPSASEVTLNTSGITATSEENRPLNIQMTPYVFLGV